MSQVIVARLKPYNPKRGHKLRRIMIDGIRFDGSKGWYEVPRGLAERLKLIHQDYYDEDSPLAFDVMSQPEAENLEAAQAAAEERKAAASSPHSTASKPKVILGGTMTTSDLAGGDGSTDGDDGGSEDGDDSSESEDAKPSASKGSRKSRGTGK